MWLNRCNSEQAMVKRVINAAGMWFGRLNTPHSRFWLLFAGLACIHLLTLMRYPPPFVDEGWMASRVWGLLQTGKNFGSLDEGVAQQFPGYWTYLPILPPLFFVLGLHWSAEPSLLAGRLMSLLSGLFVLWVQYKIILRYHGQKVALWSLILFGLSPIFFYSSHIMREDMLCAALGYLSLWMYVSDTPPRWWKMFLAGVILMAAFEAHPNSSIFIPVILILLLFDYGKKMLAMPALWFYAGGLLAGAVVYYWLHLRSYPQTFFSLYRIVLSDSRIPPIASFDFTILWQSFTQMGLFLFTAVVFILFLSLVEVVCTIRTSTMRRDRVFLINLVLWIGAIFFIRNKLFYYSVLFAPALCWLAARYLVRFQQQPWRFLFREIVKHVLVWGAVTGSVVYAFLLMSSNGWDLYRQAEQHLQSYLQRGEKLLGSQTYWFGLYDHAYISWEELYYYQNFRPGSSVAETFAYYRPDVFLIDSHLQEFIYPETEEMQGIHPYHLPQGELGAFLQAYAEETIIETPFYGPLRLYRIHWEDVPITE